MSLATACSIGLYVAGILGVLFGLDWLSNQPKEARGRLAHIRERGGEGRSAARLRCAQPIQAGSMIRRTYVPTLRSSGYAIEEHSEMEPARVIATDLGRHQAEAMARMLTAAVDQFLVDNRMQLSTRNDKSRKATLPARYRCI